MKILRHKSGNSNMYFIRQAVGFILVDAGRKSKRKALYRFLLKHKINPCDIKLIVITHSHYDHVGNLNWLKQLTKAQIIVHKSEAKYLEKGDMGELKGRSVYARFVLKLASMFSKRLSYKAVKPDILMNQELDLSGYGFNARLIHTPGHSEGSISLLINEQHVFVGDACFNLPVNRHVIPPFYQNYSSLLDSWHKLNETRGTLFYPGHGKHFGIDRFHKSIHKLERKVKKL